MSEPILAYVAHGSDGCDYFGLKLENSDFPGMKLVSSTSPHGAARRETQILRRGEGTKSSAIS